MLTAYRGLTRSLLDWGRIVLTDLSANRLLTLNRVQYACIRNVLGLMWTTPTNVLLDQAAEWRLRHMWNYQIRKTLIKRLNPH